MLEKERESFIDITPLDLMMFNQTKGLGPVSDCTEAGEWTDITKGALWYLQLILKPNG